MGSSERVHMTDDREVNARMAKMAREVSRLLETHGLRSRLSDPSSLALSFLDGGEEKREGGAS